MGEKTAIEWCDSTFNAWTGCTAVGPGCDHCYAERDMATRRKIVEWGPGKPRHRFGVHNWHNPMRWQRSHESFFLKHGRRRRVFVNSVADTFDNEVDPQWRNDLWEVIASCRDVDFLLLTKRIGNVKSMLPVFDSKLPGYKPWNERWPWQNVWIGATVVNQEEANRDIPKLLEISAPVRFLSIEPMLGRVDLCETFGMWWNQTMGCFESTGPEFNRPQGRRGLEWVIAGGESGPKARPAHPQWFRALRNQCAAAGVPFLFKQWGEWAPGECGTKSPARTEQTATWAVDRWHFGSLTPRESEEVHRDDEPDVYRLGKKPAGRLLDGVEHNGFPS